MHAILNFKFVTHLTQNTCPHAIEQGALLSWPNRSKQISQQEPGPKASILVIDQRRSLDNGVSTENSLGDRSDANDGDNDREGWTTSPKSRATYIRDNYKVEGKRHEATPSSNDITY